ncbi:hypothetical protein ACFQ7O_31870 [Streptomyces sp. NPDC056485]|uniref:hypothetical protein n=1 Tax=Streptomyces sp. NPDC056485 TaxID=3345834 RepID=UPI0036A270D0
MNQILSKEKAETDLAGQDCGSPAAHSGRVGDDRRFWRATMPGVDTGTYGAVEDLAGDRVNLNKVITHWPNMRSRS